MINISYKISPFLKILIPVIMVFTLTTTGYGADEPLSNPEFKVILDSAGRAVKVPEQVNRIACLYAFTGHAVTMLGRGSDIVAVSRGLKRDSLLHDICPSINNAIVPKSQGALNIEEVLRAAPDVLFIPGDMSGNRGEIEKLNRLGIPTIIIDYSNMESQQRAISIIGEVIGRPERAKQYNEYYKGCVEQVNTVLKRMPQDQKPRLYHSVLEATRTTLKHGLTADWLKTTGVINVALTSDMNIMEGKNFVSLEQILLWNPDIILANEPEARKLILSDRKWALINAVRNHRVYQMPIAISRWGHPGSIETPLVILWTVKQLYPDLFRDLDMKKETMSYYNTFFNHQLSESKVEAILSGRLLRKSKYDARK